MGDAEEAVGKSWYVLRGVILDTGMAMNRRDATPNLLSLVTNACCQRAIPEHQIL